MPDSITFTQNHLPNLGKTGAKKARPPVDPALSENLTELITIAREIGATSIYITRHAWRAHIQADYGPDHAQQGYITHAPLIVTIVFDQADRPDRPGLFAIEP